MINYFKKAIYLIVFTGAISANAGSYEDFFAAIPADDDQTIKSLLNRGFDPNTRDPKGLHGLFLAVREPAPRVAIALIDWPKTDVEPRTPQDESPLMIASLKGETDLANRLIKRGADVNKPGWTPLHYASTGGHVAIMRLLLDEHAYIDAAAPNGSTPLMMAAQYGTSAAVKLLLDEGADPLLRNARGHSAIDFADLAQRKDVAEQIAAFVRSRQPRGKW